MPLIFATPGQPHPIRSIGGKPQIKQHLENLGFVPGVQVTVVSTLGGNVIVNVKDTRIAISREMANHIILEGVRA